MHHFAQITFSDLIKRPQEIAAPVCEALRREGFLTVAQHPASVALMDRAENLTAQLFTEFSPEALEQAYGRPDLFRSRGVSPLFAEQAVGYSAPDVKQFWMLRDETWPEDMERDAPYGENIWPDALLPEFRSVMGELMEAYKAVGMAVLHAVELGYDLGEGKLTGMAHGAESMLRPIFYPGLRRMAEMHVPLGAQRSAPHGDINALTVLRPKLGLWARLHGSWVKADASDPSLLWVNIGEMLAQVEGVHDLVPTIHCVGNPPGMTLDESTELEDDRVAIPFFLHFRHSTMLRPGLNTGTWFQERIEEITKK